VSELHGSDVHTANKALLTPLRAALYDHDADTVRQALNQTFAPGAEVHLAYPFEDLEGAAGLYDEALGPLSEAWPDLERRDHIVMAGPDPDGENWVGCSGYYMGTFVRPWLDIPPTGRAVAMRFHEFYRVVDGAVVEMQALWDLPEVMRQAGVWPMGPSLGREWQVPGPATQDGLVPGPRDGARSEASAAHVVAMLVDMGRHPAEPVEAMNLERWWHPRMSWYGPSGIGTGRGISGFRRHHQIPFLKALPDRRGGYQGDAHFFGDGDYVGVTAWPGMAATVTGDGWLGLPPTGQAITMRSLDFWRVERSHLPTAGGDPDITVGAERLLIRENWVLVDLLHVWHQLGVDVLARMRELGGTRG